MRQHPLVREFDNDELQLTVTGYCLPKILAENLSGLEKLNLLWRTKKMSTCREQADFNDCLPYEKS